LAESGNPERVELHAKHSNSSTLSGLIGHVSFFIPWVAPRAIQIETLQASSLACCYPESQPVFSEQTTA
jgi:hypothetical protein